MLLSILETRSAPCTHFKIAIAIPFALVLGLFPTSRASSICPRQAHLSATTVTSSPNSVTLNVSVLNYPTFDSPVPAGTAIDYITAPCVCRAETHSNGALCTMGTTGSLVLDYTGDSFRLVCTKSPRVEPVECHPEVISFDGCDSDVPLPIPLVVMDSRVLEDDGGSDDEADTPHDIKMVTRLDCTDRVPPSAGLHAIIQEQSGLAVVFNVSVQDYPSVDARVPSGTEIEFSTGPCICKRGDNGHFTFLGAQASVVLAKTGWNFWLYCTKDDLLTPATSCLPKPTLFDGCPVHLRPEDQDIEQDICEAPTDARLYATTQDNYGHQVRISVSVQNYPRMGAFVPAGTRIGFTTGTCVCSGGDNGQFRFSGKTGYVVLDHTGWAFWLDCRKEKVSDPSDSCLPIATEFDGCLTPAGEIEEQEFLGCQISEHATLRTTIQGEMGTFLRMKVSVKNYPQVGARVPADTEIVFSTGACTCTSGDNGDFRFQGHLGSVLLSKTGWSFWLNCVKEEVLTPPDDCLPMALSFDGCWGSNGEPLSLSKPDIPEPDEDGDQCGERLDSATLSARVDHEENGSSRFEVTVMGYPNTDAPVPANTYIEFSTGSCRCWQGRNGEFFFVGRQGSVFLSKTGYTFWLECHQPATAMVKFDCPIIATRFDNCSADGSLLADTISLKLAASSQDHCSYISTEATLQLNVLEDQDNEAQLEMAVLNYPQFGMPVPAGTVIEFTTGRCHCHNGMNGDFEFTANTPMVKLTTQSAGWSLLLFCKHPAGANAERDCGFVPTSFDGCTIPTSVPMVPLEDEAGESCFGPDSEGDIIIQTESASLSGSWSFLNDEEEQTTGQGYLLWTGDNTYITPRTGFLTYNIVLDNDQAGEYNLEMYTSRANTPETIDWDEGNDVWFSTDETTWHKFLTSFGCPLCPVRPSRYGEWFFSNTVELANKTYKNATVTFESGRNILELAGRSRGYKIDRMALRRVENTAELFPPNRLKTGDTTVRCI